MKNKEEKKKLLVIVDMIRGFVETGNMADPTIAHINEEVERLAKLFIQNEDDIIAFQDMHENGCKEFTKFPEHCVKGTIECDLIPCLQKLESQMIKIPKNSTCGFITKEFGDYIKVNKDKLKEIVVVGCCTDICVMNFVFPMINYIDEENLNTELIVPEDAVETFHAPNHDREEYNGMAKVLMKQAGAKVVRHY